MQTGANSRNSSTWASFVVAIAFLPWWTGSVNCDSICYWWMGHKWQCDNHNLQFKSTIVVISGGNITSLVSKTCILVVSKIWGSCCCSVAQLCLTFWVPTDGSMPGVPVLHYLLELAQTHVHCVSDAIQPCHPSSSFSPAALNLSQHQGLFFQCVSSLPQVAKVLELQLQHQSFQWIFGTDFL